MYVCVYTHSKKMEYMINLLNQFQIKLIRLKCSYCSENYFSFFFLNNDEYVYNFESTQPFSAATNQMGIMAFSNNKGQQNNIRLGFNEYDKVNKEEFQDLCSFQPSVLNFSAKPNNTKVKPKINN